VVGGLGALQQPAVDELPGEAHLHPNAGLGGLTCRRVDEIVERPVEVRERHVDAYARDR
jgi:hypothetical protein